MCLEVGKGCKYADTHTAFTVDMCGGDEGGNNEVHHFQTSPTTAIAVAASRTHRTPTDSQQLVSGDDSLSGDWACELCWKARVLFEYTPADDQSL